MRHLKVKGWGGDNTVGVFFTLFVFPLLREGSRQVLFQVLTCQEPIVPVVQSGYHETSNWR